MIRFFMLVVFLLFIGVSWPFIENQWSDTDFIKIMKTIETELNDLSNNPDVQTTLDELQGVFKKFNSEDHSFEKAEEKKIELKAPTRQFFSIYNIELGMTKDAIEKQLGQAQRTSLNEYGTEWYAYHDDYQGFVMVMYDEKKQAGGLYTNQNLISSASGIKLGSSKTLVHSKLGEPMTNIRKGFILYQLQEDRDYDLFESDGSYVTIFYDKHQNNTVKAMQLISKDLETRKNEMYTKANAKLKEGFEYQMFDLTNAERVQHRLLILTWDQHVRNTAREHSLDMATNNYFDHINLEGESPFDRMKKDQISFQIAGENLAYGQFSSIFAHEGLMNSLGHRENILQKEFEYLGIGVAFNEQAQPYFTQNFYAK
ncbi:CAP domain-containing protein [Pseudoneobacillus sp. C159]